jgi:tetratricopeptide (TPR) repeat protein
MKAEKRKELQTNVLADRLGKLVQGFREGFGRPSNTWLLIWGGIIAVIVVVIGIKVYSNSVTRSRSAEWLSLAEADNLSDVERIAEKNPKAKATQIARFQLARVYLRRGMEHFVSTISDGRKDALRDLDEAAKLYGELATEVKDNPILTQEALLGIGKAREALNELDDALAAYEQLASRYPDSVDGKEAAERAKKLRENKAQVSAFYKELDKKASPPTNPKSEIPNPKSDVSPP